jgi:hypothetical protein
MIPGLSCRSKPTVHPACDVGQAEPERQVVESVERSGKHATVRAVGR